MFFNSINEMDSLLSKGIWMFLMVFFNSIKEINRLTKEMNRLLSKALWNIYLKCKIHYPFKGASTKNFRHTYQILAVKGGGGLSESVKKENS